MIKLTGNKVYPLSSSYHTLELPPSLLEYASPLLPPFELAPTLLPDFSSLFSISFLLLLPSPFLPSTPHTLQYTYISLYPLDPRASAKLPSDHCIVAFLRWALPRIDRSSLCGIKESGEEASVASSFSKLLRLEEEEDPLYSDLVPSPCISIFELCARVLAYFISQEEINQMRKNVFP